MTLYCKDCKHFHEIDAAEANPIFHRCKNPRLVHHSLVHGDKVKPQPATFVRDNVNMCGPEGNWFELRSS